MKRIRLNKEIVVDIIDIFEEFLESKGVKLENPEVQESGVDPESATNIFGSDFVGLCESISDTMEGYGIDIVDTFEPLD